MLTREMTALTFWTVVALFISVTGLPRVFAQDNGDPPKKATNAQAEAKDGKLLPVQNPPKKTQSGARFKKPSAIPNPTVVLKPGEIPAIVFAKPAFDFGRVRSGEQITHDFTFSNIGNGALEILKVKPG